MFVSTLYHKLPSTDPLKTTVYNYATNMLGSLYQRTDSSAYPEYKDWKDPAKLADGPGCGFVAMAFATGYGYVSQSQWYKNRALEAAQAMNQYYQNNKSSLQNPMITDSDCTRSAKANNIMAIMAAGLADVALHLFPGDPYSFPYRDALTTFANYARNSKNSNNDLWRYGGGSNDTVDGGARKKCAMILGYDVWVVAGLAKAAVGTTYTRPPNTPSSVFWTTARAGVNGLQTLKNLNGVFPQYTGGNYTNNVSKSEAPGHVLPVSWAKEQAVLDMAIRDVGGYLKAAEDENGGDGDEANFHRLLWGLTGAMEYNLTIAM